MTRKDFNVYQGAAYTERVQWLGSEDGVKDLLGYTAMGKDSRFVTILPTFKYNY